MSDDILLSHKVYEKYTHLILCTHACLMYTVVKDTLQRSMLPQLIIVISKTSFPSVVLCYHAVLNIYSIRSSFILKLGKPFCVIRTQYIIKHCNILFPYHLHI